MQKDTGYLLELSFYFLFFIIPMYNKYVHRVNFLPTVHICVNLRVEQFSNIQCCKTLVALSNDSCNKITCFSRLRPYRALALQKCRISTKLLTFNCVNHLEYFIKPN